MSEWLVLCLPDEAALRVAEAQPEVGSGGEEVGTGARAVDAAVAAAAWARVADGRVVASGLGDGWAAARDSGAASRERVVALAPAGDVPVRFMAYAEATPPQASAAARVDALKQILGDRAQLHVVAAVPADVGQRFAVAVVRHRAMEGWTAWLAAKGLQADAIVPVAAVLDAPAGAGLVAADVGGERVMRSADHGYASDAALDELMAAGGPVRLMGADAVAQALAALAVAADGADAGDKLPLNLLAGAWAVKPDWQGNVAQWRWIKRLALLAAALVLAVLLVTWGKLMRDAAQADAAVIAAGASAGIAADDAAAVEAELDRRLAQKSGGPLAFSVPASALYGALEQAPVVSLKSLSHRADGTVTAMIAGPRVEDLNPVLLALQARGYRITAQPLAGSDGQQMANVTIRAVP